MLGWAKSPAVHLLDAAPCAPFSIDFNFDEFDLDLVDRIEVYPFAMRAPGYKDNDE